MNPNTLQPPLPTTEPVTEPRRNNAFWLVLLIGICSIVAVVLTIALLVSALLVGRSTSAELTTTRQMDTQATVEPSEPADEIANADAAIDQTPEIGSLLLAFGEMWRTADWEQMSTIATAEVVSTAKEWHTFDGQPNLGDENIVFVLDSCQALVDGETSCFFTYDRGEGFGLIFDATIGSKDSALWLTGLAFAGDAG